MGQGAWHGICCCGATKAGLIQGPVASPVVRRPFTVATMYFPQFLVGMVATSGSLAIWAYCATGSVWVALAWTAMSAALLQVGYFMLLARLIYLPDTPEGTKADHDASRSELRVPVRRIALIAIAVLATVAMTVITRAEDGDAYFDCVVGKAEAIMKKQTQKDAEAALEKAYALCQPIESSQQADIGSGSPLSEHPGRLYPLANS
jgi:hypothetical protein